jgi:hypothetical protein
LFTRAPEKDKSEARLFKNLSIRPLLKFDRKFKKKEMKMKIAKRLLMSAGAVVLVAVSLIVAAPKTVQAVVATLIRDVDNPARATLVSGQCRVQNVTGAFGCSPAYTVPASDRLVIQQVDASCTTNQGTSVPNASVDISTGGAPANHTFPLVNEASNVPPFLIFGNSQTVTFYADPDSTISFLSETNGSGATTLCTFNFSGYLVSYP